MMLTVSHLLVICLIFSLMGLHLLHTKYMSVDKLTAVSYIYDPIYVHMIYDPANLYTIQTAIRLHMYVQV